MPIAPGQKPGLRAYEDSVRFTPAEIVTGLREILGARLVAYLGHVSSTRPVGEWADGAHTPSQDTIDRLRAAYFIAALLREHEGAATVQSWFMGMNPQLNDQAPARVLRDSPLQDVSPDIVAAARAFAYMG